MQIVEDRRRLHRIPELDRELPKTMAYLRQSLSGLSCQLFSPIEGSLCAWFDFGAESTIAFRSDADALPIQENTQLPFSSEHPGKMHACGHDGHMAILLELARRLNKKKALKHNVLLVFQPAEETTGGARDLCETGIFKQYAVAAIFGLHLWPGLEKGVVASRKNEMMSRSCEVTVDIYGKSAHIAKADEGIDAMSAGVTFYTLACLLENGLSPKIYRLLKFGKLESGTVRNAVSGHTHIEGSLRAFQDSVFEGLKSGIVSIGKYIEQSTGCTVHITMSDGYPAVMNPEELYNRVRNCADFAELPQPSMTTEDFSWYQQQIPGLFFFLGIGNTPALHASDFTFDENILLKGADFFEKLAENFQ